MVDFFGQADSFQKNVDVEYDRNGERYTFLRWGSEAFQNFRVVPPGTGICHQVNLEYLAQTVWTKEENGETIAYPDTLVGTDSHTTMVNGLSVLGWGVGGIEAEAAMLGQPVSMLIPEVVGFRIDGQAARGHDRDRSRAHRHADAAQEGRRRQVRRVLRPRPLQPHPRGPGDHRQHGPRIRRDLRLLPRRHGHAELPRSHRPRQGPDRARRGLFEGAGHVPRGGHGGPGLHRHARARPLHRRALARRPEAPAGPRRADRRRDRFRPRPSRSPGRPQEVRRRHLRG